MKKIKKLFEWIETSCEALEIEVYDEEMKEWQGKSWYTGKLSSLLSDAEANELKIRIKIKK